MVERQPNRPSEEEFIGAALRFIDHDYQEACVSVMWGGVARIRVGQGYDLEIIYHEQEADGRLGEDESVLTFAKRQLAAYRKLGKA